MLFSDRLVQLRPLGTTVLVGVDGAGGSGKSTFARSLQRVNPDVVDVVEMDDFFRPVAARPSGIGREKPVGGDFDWERLRDEVLAPLRHQVPASYQRYDWDGDSLAEWHDVESGGVVVVEGVYSLRAELRPSYDLCVWVDAPRDVRLARGLKRDGDEARSCWEVDWMPAEDRYIDEQRSRDVVDIVVDGTDTGGLAADSFVLVRYRRHL